MSTTPTLFEKLDGASGVEPLVLAFYARVMDDPELAPFFEHTSMVKLHTMQREFFAMALGGPISWAFDPGCDGIGPLARSA